MFVANVMNAAAKGHNLQTLKVCACVVCVCAYVGNVPVYSARIGHVSARFRTASG